MTWTPRRKAIVFASSLLLVSVALVGTAVATTGSAILPFARGQSYGEERSLTRGDHLALAVRVGQMTDTGILPLSGAMVSVARMAASGFAEKPLATGTTGPRGVATFELKPGAYRIAVNQGALASSHEVRLTQSTLLYAVFDAGGDARWQEMHHSEVEQKGDLIGLVVKVGRNESGTRGPVANATVEIYRIQKDNSTEKVAMAKTGPRGLAGFQLPRGPYLIKVLADGIIGEHPVRLQENTAVGVMIDGPDVHWRVAPSSMTAGR